MSGVIHKDDPIYDDVSLLRAEAERCRVILGELDDYQSTETADLQTPIPLSTVIDEIVASRIGDLDKEVVVTLDERSAMPMPLVRRGPELLHALEDLLRNAGDFAKSRITVQIRCSVEDVLISIHDDGPGFSPGVLARIGAPWNSSRTNKGSHRGLGIFIASTLIEALGGSILYGNSKAGGGEVKIQLSRNALESR